ncbi:RNI-like protein [Gigaspora margarita]|uniref:RNI-like protein n=1 Tax=Gigaspora margarita TaxID=4874 RepID=A0A8H4EUJ5_GIGMA|nr:RNI-like protein [Gigaspora margarita]
MPNYTQLAYLIVNLLFKLFVESGATLHKLDLYFRNYEINPEIFYSLEQNEQFFSRLQSLSLGVTSHFNIDSATRLLRILAKTTTKLSALNLGRFYSDNGPQLFKILLCIIKSQEKIRQFTLVGECLAEFHGIISALEIQRNSLQEIKLEHCDYSAEFDILKDCNNLEILRIRYCDMKLLKILNDKVNTLEIVDFQIDATPIVQILEKSGTLLKRLILASTDREIWKEYLLLGALKSFCPNITYLKISNIGFSVQLIELIGNLQKLQFLTLWCNDFITEELKTRVIQFAKTLPLTLQYLDLWDNLLELYIDIFLNHCNAPLNKLIIYHLDNEKISKALIDFCIRNKTLNYVGVDRYFKLDDDIRKEVEKYVSLVPYERVVVNC